MHRVPTYVGMCCKRHSNTQSLFPFIGISASVWATWSLPPFLGSASGTCNVRDKLFYTSLDNELFIIVSVVNAGLFMVSVVDVVVNTAPGYIIRLENSLRRGPNTLDRDWTGNELVFALVTSRLHTQGCFQKFKFTFNDINEWKRSVTPWVKWIFSVYCVRECAYIFIAHTRTRKSAPRLCRARSSQRWHGAVAHISNRSEKKNVELNYLPTVLQRTGYQISERTAW